MAYANRPMEKRPPITGAQLTMNEWPWLASGYSYSTIFTGIGSQYGTVNSGRGEHSRWPIIIRIIISNGQVIQLIPK